MEETFADLERRLYPALLNAAREAFRRVREDHPGERFYTFGLFMDGEASYILPTSNTEEALLRSSHGYAKTPLRWNPCDLGYHLYANDGFEAISDILNDGDDSEDGFDIDDEDPVRYQAWLDRVELRFNTILNVCERVLKELDQEGIFGSKAERESILLNIFTVNDSYEDRVEQAKRLNPSALVARYKFEVEFCDEWPPEAELPPQIPEDYL